MGLGQHARSQGDQEECAWIGRSVRRIVRPHGRSGRVWAASRSLRAVQLDEGRRLRAQDVAPQTTGHGPAATPTPTCWTRCCTGIDQAAVWRANSAFSTDRSRTTPSSAGRAVMASASLAKSMPSSASSS
ncbi:MAG: hypothetical protein K0Q52_3475 [Microbacterium sp.]|nr:hypothetical protein [Microbacterium sp.]